jgi:hypothetical protein
MIKDIFVSVLMVFAMAAVAAAQDPFVGTWKLNPAKSQFDPNHRPLEATMTFEIQPDGSYLMKAEGTKEGGQKVQEHPQTFFVDGQPRPIPELPGLSAVATRPDPNTLRGEARREDGSIVGSGTYAVSAGGKSLTATVSGVDSQLRTFTQVTVWDRQ